MVLYEVTLKVDRNIAKDYFQWLEEHVREMESFPGFGQAAIWELDGGDSEQKEWVVAYPVANRESLTRYLEEDAPRMRDDGRERFGKAFSATRRIGQLVSTDRPLAQS